MWVAFAVVFFGTLVKRRDRAHLRRQLVLRRLHPTVAVLHVVNTLALPVSLWQDPTPLYAGVQDAMVQWWYGHNAVGFFLTAGFLGIMYYFVPKQAERPVFPTGCRSCTSGR